MEVLAGNLTIWVQGAQMVSEVDTLKTVSKKGKDGKKITKTVVDTTKVDIYTVKVRTAHDPKKFEIITFHTRKKKLIPHSVNISRTAYLSFISKKEVPDSVHPIKWYTMTQEERLLWHFKAMCHDFGGKYFTFQIFEE